MKYILWMVPILGLVMSGSVGIAANPKDKDILQGKPLSEWIAEVKSPDENKSMTALGVIANLGPKAQEAVPVLVEGLKEALVRKENGAVRILGYTRALGAIGPEAKAAIPLLTPLLQRTDFRNVEVAQAIVNIGATPAEELAAVRILLLSVFRCYVSPC